jgi:ABC-type Fe3+-hydroxamate transport system substrate-binding protein
MDRKLIAAMPLMAALALAACSSTGGGAAPTSAAGGAGGGASAAGGNAGGGGGGSAPSDPCALITQAEVSAAVGKQVGAGSNATDSHACEWDYPNSDSPEVMAGITIEDGDLASFCGKPSDPALGLVIEQVQGVGDGACFTYVTTTTLGSNFTFSKNGHVYSTNAYFGGGTPIATVEAAAKALALAALGHI